MIITQTPLRISFAGGGTDFPEYYRDTEHMGAVISTTIDKYIYVMVKKRFDKLIVAHYRQTELVEEVSELKHDLIRECLKFTGIKEQIEITPTADIPGTGSGLGSSSTLTVGLLNALYNYIGFPQTKAKLAENACKIEIDILKSPIGKQDQYAACYGGFHLIRFYPHKVFIDPIPLSQDTLNELQQNLLLFYTGLISDSKQILSKQKKNIPDKICVLDKMLANVLDIKNALMNKNLSLFAILLNQGWELKKMMEKSITNPKIDEIYKIGLNAGALGGKICGSGGGGFILFYCPIENQKKLRQSLKNLQELPFRFENFGTRVLLNVHK